jgi:hypothetical protein
LGLKEDITNKKIYPEKHDYTYTGAGVSTLGITYGSKGWATRTSYVYASEGANQIARYYNTGWGNGMVNYTFVMPFGFCI